MLFYLNISSMIDICSYLMKSHFKSINFQVIYHPVFFRLLISREINKNNKMSGVVSFDIESINRAPECNVHLLPCEIDYSGPAKVQEYFSSTIKNTEDNNDNGIYNTNLHRLIGYPLDFTFISIENLNFIFIYNIINLLYII